jgi:D-alanine-D-alanine ligase
MAVSSNKLATKDVLSQCDIATPAWCTDGERAARQGGTWIVKPVWEDGSVGIDDGAVVEGSAVRARLDACRHQHGGEWFAERYVDGREFNVSLLAGPEGVQALPVPEIRFTGYPAGKPRIVGYAAKWDADSFESQNTKRRFLPRHEQALESELMAVARATWQALGFAGYARVDLRADASGRLYVIEANANPCLAPDAGFQAALARAGIPFPDAVRQIVAAAGRGRQRAPAPRPRAANAMVH